MRVCVHEPTCACVRMSLRARVCVSVGVREWMCVSEGVRVALRHRASEQAKRGRWGSGLSARCRGWRQARCGRRLERCGRRRERREACTEHWRERPCWGEGFPSVPPRVRCVQPQARRERLHAQVPHVPPLFWLRSRVL